LLKILAIDDSAVIHILLRACLFGTKHVLADVLSGESGLNYLRSEKPVDLILLDWNLPGLSGPEVFKQFRKEGFAIPTIMMTAKADSQNVQEMLNAGVSEYIMKPFTREILFGKMERVVREKFKNVG
jgi:DNA-binding response OmpR family regulator